MKKLIALVLALCLSLGLSIAMADETFKMGIDAEYPPFSYLDDNGEYAGFDVEMCKAVCDMLDWNLEIVPVNWDTKLISLDNKEHDCVWSGMTILDSMKEAGYVLSFPYYDNTQVVLTKDGNGISTSPTTTTSTAPWPTWPANVWQFSWAPPAKPCWLMKKDSWPWPRPLKAERL